MFKAIAIDYDMAVHLQLLGVFVNQDMISTSRCNFLPNSRPAGAGSSAVFFSFDCE
jgi:hypothetical protein